MTRILLVPTTQVLSVPVPVPVPVPEITLVIGDNKSF
jgi:hypothetical protein